MLSSSGGSFEADQLVSTDAFAASDAMSTSLVSVAPFFLRCMFSMQSQLTLASA